MIKYKRVFLENRRILYHGALEKFDTFFGKKPIFLTDNIDFAYNYASSKSFNQGRDSDIFIYQCEVNIDFFDPNKKNHLDKLEKVLPDEIKVANDTGWMQYMVDKESVIQRMSGWMIDYGFPMEKLRGVKAGERFVYDVYQQATETYLGKDSKYVYYIDNNRFKDYFTYSDDRAYYRNPYKDTILKDYFKFLKKYEFEYEGDERKKISIELEKEYKRILPLVMKQMIKDNICNKHAIKDKKVKADDNWTYFENETIIKLIHKLGFKGYIAKENKVSTYAVFNPKNVKIIKQVDY